METSVAYGLDDEEARVRAAQQDPNRFGPLYDFYAPRVYRYILHRIGNINGAEDLTSQVFVDALEALGRYRSQGSFAGWLFTIARRRCADYFRRNQSLPLLEGESVDPQIGLADQAMDRDEEERLAAILRGLSDQELELLRLRFAAELTYRQIGEVLGKSEGAVKMSSTRLIQQMRACWEQNNG